jgi:isoquinoline 1-oxidoreductase beta subunit
MLSTAIDRTSVEGAANLPYEIPNLRVEWILKDPGVPVGFWRSVGSSQNAFVTECFLDEIAAAGGTDPYELRRMFLRRHPRHLGVLELAAAKAGWGSPLPKGRYRGIAVAESYGSFVAEVAEISLADDGAVRVHRVVCAADCGKYVNPDTIEAQMQGGIVFGLTAALRGSIAIEKGRVKESNFHDYQMLRMLEMPVVEVHIVKSREAPGGVGEPGVPPIAPAVANALFAATGKRIRTLPIRQEELKHTALKGKAAG